MDRRISFAACLLSQLVPTAEIKAQLQGRYECSRRMCEKYISRGRERLKKWSEIPPEQVRSEIVGLLQGLLRSNLDVREKLAAIDRLIAIFGLAAPQDHTLRGDKDNPIVSRVQIYIPDNGRSLRGPGRNGAPTAAGAAGNARAE